MAEFLSDNIFYLLPLLVLFPFAMMAIANRLYAATGWTTCAQRMGLAIAQGDPKLNMVNAIPAHNFKRGTSTGSNWLSRLANSTTETKVLRLIGSPRGRPTEFVYYRREDTKDRLLVVTTDSWFEFRMSVEVPVAFPEFEIVRRHPHMGIYGAQAQARAAAAAAAVRCRGIGPQVGCSRRPSRGWDRSSARAVGRCSTSLEFVPAPAGEAALCARLATQEASMHAVRRLSSCTCTGGDGALHWLATQEASMHAVRRLPQAQQVLERIADVLAGPVQRPR